MLDQILNKIGQISERATVKTVFGEPYQVDGRTVVPVAKVSYGFGFGAGRGSAKESEENESAGVNDMVAGGRSAGTGGGGGGRVSVRPVAVLEMSAAGTGVRPIVDVTKIALAAMALVAWNVFWISYTVRRTAGRRPAERD